ncbi:hypothetical protein M409DRAFT_60649 [Zasmidium cellare ATCC 36951]|uniref:Uncharacterized protein n=1 Tax=Zasmidium cellare ATCC 36951 TaxID=1080233 RepID=A0A6A6C1J3_ZASCE|nr:uncharacterized protein M409DRAFT_60649 [Zasmidium cellare ATCC 36951]KAF2159576.1 hypothetical protein M409DRAFT_60649 [Zasmidium cellare ATCC 36951]
MQFTSVFLTLVTAALAAPVGSPTVDEAVKVRAVEESVATHPPLRAGSAYEDIADALVLRSENKPARAVSRSSKDATPISCTERSCKVDVEASVATHPPLRAGSAYEDIADALVLRSENKPARAVSQSRKDESKKQRTNQSDKVDVEASVATHPPLRAGSAYEDIADALVLRSENKVARVVDVEASVATHPPLRAGSAYEDIADALS